MDISFDRERRVIRALADAVARVGRKPVAVGVEPTANAPDPNVSTGAVAPPDAEPTELERFAYELQERARQQTRERGDRRTTPRHGVTRGYVANVVLPEAGTAFERTGAPRRRSSDRVGAGWYGAAPTPHGPSGTSGSPASDEGSAPQAPATASNPTAGGATSPAGPTTESITATPAAAATRTTAATAATTATTPGAPEANARAARYLGALVAAYGPLDPSDAAIDAPLVDVLVLDASALVALARGNVRARAHLSRAVGALARIVIPATALVDAAHARVANAIADVTQVDASIAKTAARLIADTGTNAPTTALAIALAARGDRAAVLTADVATANAYARAIDGATRPYVLTV